jgi:AMIN domain
MKRSLRITAGLLVWAAMYFPLPAVCQAQAVPSIRRVQVLGGRDQVEIEIEASERVLPHVNVLTGPDRLVVDFVNAVPGARLRNQTVSRGEVKSLRVGLFSANPPVTRVVVVLNGPQPYQVFPSGRNVIVKVGGGGTGATAGLHSGSSPSLVTTSYAAAGAHLSVPVALPKPALEVSFRRGLLSISSNKASLSEVLTEVHRQTGAEIAIPAGSDQEQVVAEIGPAPAPEVLSQLLNGSRFNFLILSSTSDPRALDRVILSSRPEGPMPPPQPARPQARAVVNEDADTDAEPNNPPIPRPMPAPADPAADKTPGDPNTPN